MLPGLTGVHLKRKRTQGSDLNRHGREGGVGLPFTHLGKWRLRTQGSVLGES